MVGSSILQVNIKGASVKLLKIEKIYLVLLLALVLLPVNVISAVLDWDTNNWPLPSLAQTYNIGGSNINISFSGDTGQINTTGNPASPETSQFLTGGTTNEDALFIRTDFANTGQSISTTLDFTHPGGVSDVSFTFWDVDATSPQWIDQVQVTATAGGSTVNPSSITDGVTNNPGVNTSTGFPISSNAANNSSDGNVTFTFNQTNITQVVITYRNTTTGTPGNQWISLHDITFDIAPTLSKSFSPDTMTVGDVSTLTISLGNNDVSAATLTSHLVDNLPAGVTVASPANIGGTCPGTTNAPGGGSTITYTTGSTIPAGGCTITVDVTSSSVGTVTNTIAANALQTDLGNNGIAASDDLTSTAVVAPTVSKTFSPDPIVINGTSTLTISLGNTNTLDATLSAALVDTLPTAGNGDVVVAPTPNIAGTCASANLSAVPGATSITYANGATIPAGGCTILVDVTSGTAGTYTNTISAGALQTDLGNNVAAASDTLTVNLTSPPTVTKSFSPGTITAGGSSQLTISLGNINASAITLLTNMDDNLPTGVVATSVNTVATTCTDALVDISNNARVRYTSGATIPSGGCNIVVNVTSNTLGTVTNTIAANALQTNAGNNANPASDNLTVNAGGGFASCPSGQTLSTASPNPSYASAQTNVGVTNPNNALGTYSGAGSGANNANSANLRANDILRLEFTDTVAQNSTVIVSLARDNNNGRVNLAFSDDGINEDVQVGTFGNGGTLGSGAVDVLSHIALTVPGDGFRYLIIRRLNGRNWVDGASYDQICVTPPTADLTITKDDSSLTYTPGSTATYTIVVTNNGPDNVTGATIADNLPNGVTMTAPWTCTPSSGSSSCNTAPSTTNPISIDVDIVNGDSITVTVPVQFSSDMNDYQSCIAVKSRIFYPFCVVALEGLLFHNSIGS